MGEPYDISYMGEPDDISYMGEPDDISYMVEPDDMSYMVTCHIWENLIKIGLLPLLWSEQNFSNGFCWNGKASFQMNDFHSLSVHNENDMSMIRYGDMIKYETEISKYVNNLRYFTGMKPVVLWKRMNYLI